jgi:membrane-bound lytic murein transglycosylase B
MFYGVIVSITLLSTIKLSYSSLSEEEIQEKIKFFKPVIDKLIANDIDSNFVYSIFSNPNINFNEKYVKINVTGYLKKADYSHNYNENSISNCIEFIENYTCKLDECEMKYNVPREVIAAIIWIETKNGGYLGSHNILSVYLSTAMADKDEYIALNKKILREDFTGTEDELAELDKKIESRAAKKAKWAVNELKSLSKIYKMGSMDIFRVRGSWAGAFGLSQFLPSSYLRCAVDGNSDNEVDLYNVDDAIFSVANYLKMAGWSKDPDDERKAIHSYNNSNEYVNAVLTLSEKITSAMKKSE